MKRFSNLLYDSRFEHDACGMGFVAQINGKKDHKLIEKALIALKKMNHRGGTGAEPDTGDGAGILSQLPDRFFQKEARRLGFSLPIYGNYGVGQLFLPKNSDNKQQMLKSITNEIKNRGLKVLGKREVPFVYQACGPTARKSMPGFIQIFIEKPLEFQKGREFEDLLFRLRRHLEKTYSSKRLIICSLSSRTIVYKGMLQAYQLSLFYPDLHDQNFKSAIAVIHSRFSTNTFPSWGRAQPYRFLCHNGEINTLKGDENWMMSHNVEVYHKDDTDSAKLENCMEYLYRNGYDIPEALFTMIPEAWAKSEDLSNQEKAFNEYNESFMTPWDGPAALCFTDGIQVGAFLDRNGLRPSHYTVDKNNIMVAASESGVVDIPPQDVKIKGNLGPSNMILIDTSKGKLYGTKEIKQKYYSSKPYLKWIKNNQLKLEQLPKVDMNSNISKSALETLWRRHGYTDDIIQEEILPMAKNGEEPIKAMGFDSPLAVLSNKSESLFTYFKQGFAQVTNPPIDAIRENSVIETQVYLGKDADVSKRVPENARKIKLKSPFLTDNEFAQLRNLNLRDFHSTEISLAYDKNIPRARRLERALDNIFKIAEQAIDNGSTFLILTDQDATESKLIIPVLLAVAGLNSYLVKKGLRSEASIIVDTGEACEINHYAALLGYGASAIHPYGAYATINYFSLEDKLPNYINACEKGIIKIMSRMGISTINGYQGSQLFEAIGLSSDLIKNYFPGTPSRIGGIGLEQIEDDYYKRYLAAYGPKKKDTLASGGSFKYRINGEHHLFNPVTLFKFQQAVRRGDYHLFKEYLKEMNSEMISNPTSLRSMWKLKPKRASIPLSEVEPIKDIIKHFKSGAMSFGALSKEAHETIAQAMNELGAKSDNGEGGEDEKRFKVSRNGKNLNSKIKQVASARFGVNAEYLMSAEEIQIKMAQGAKPGEGGQLAANKNYPWIAKCRGAVPGVRLISPPPHHDIYSIEDLKQLIYDLRKVNPYAQITVKLVSSTGVGTIATGVIKAGANKVTICGYDGGTGAAPRNSLRDTGLPWEMGLADAHQTLSINNLRQRSTLETDGKLMTGRDIAIAAMLGAEEFSFASLVLVSIGCIMMRVCNLNTCPTGVCTQNPRLRKFFIGKPEYVKNTMRFLARNLQEILAHLGFHSIDELVGHTECLKPRFVAKGKAKYLNYKKILSPHFYIQPKDQDPFKEKYQWTELDSFAKGALKLNTSVTVNKTINNTQRATGSRIGGWIAERFGNNKLKPGLLKFNYSGVAGQSFGAFITQGLQLKLTGEANDYVGKGLSGGRLIVKSPPIAQEIYSKAPVVGNVACFGATSGEAYFNGRAGERFCVRNSGADVVVEGIGNHGCEYMTGGHALVIGSTGQNFGAGMSGGIAYIYDPKHVFKDKVNLDMVDLYSVSKKIDLNIIKKMLKKHVLYTDSSKGLKILKSWKNTQKDFVKVYPKDYHEIQKAIRHLKEKGTNNNLLEKAFELVVNPN